MYNKIYTSIFDKKKILEVPEKSTSQVSRTKQKQKKEEILNNMTTEKTYATILANIFIPLFLKHI